MKGDFGLAAPLDGLADLDDHGPIAWVAVFDVVACGLVDRSGSVGEVGEAGYVSVALGPGWNVERVRRREEKLLRNPLEKFEVGVNSGATAAGGRPGRL